MTPDALVKVPKLQEAVGAAVQYDTVLLIEKDGAVSVGNPFVASAKVSATVFAHDRTKKTRGHIYTRRTQFKKTWGFRESFTLLKVTGISK